MIEYIDKKLLIRTLKNKKDCINCTDTDCVDCICDFIACIVSSDVVEVVRCKDCKHSREQDRVFGITDYKCSKHNISCLSPYDFCSYGERRDA